MLVYAFSPSAKLQPAAQSLIRQLAEGDEPWGIPVFCLGEFLRVVTHPAIMSRPSSPEEACNILERVIEAPSCQVFLPGPRYPALFLDAVRESRGVGNLVFDAQIAALCREAGVDVLITEDAHFSRFRGIKVRNLG